MASHKPSTPADESDQPALGRPHLGRNLVETELLMLLGLLAFVGLAFLLERAPGLGDAVRLGPIAAIAISAVPALLWLGYFYRQDRHEPEPHHYVFGVFLLGAFIAGPVAAFVVERALPTNPLAGTGLSPLAIERVVAAVFVIGLAQELAKYSVLRYTMYLSREFDEPLDGIVYATAAGVGFATYENVQFFTSADNEVLISAAAASTVVTTLAHACFAGIIGYVLGRAKFIATAPWRRTLWLLGGVVVAGALNGAFRVLSDAVGANQINHAPWRPVAFTFGFAVVIFFIISLLARQLLAISPHAEDAS